MRKFKKLADTVQQHLCYAGQYYGPLCSNPEKHSEACACAGWWFDEEQALPWIDNARNMLYGAALILPRKEAARLYRMEEALLILNDLLKEA